MENMTMEELYKERDQLLRVKEVASDKAWALDLEIERRKASNNDDDSLPVISIP